MADVTEKECPDCRSMIHPQAKVCPHCKHRFGGLGGKAALGVIGLLGLLAFCTREHQSGPTPQSTALADTAGNPGEGGGSGTITAAQYSRIANGMTYEEVAEIMGSPGEEQVNSEIAGMRGRIVSWKNWSGANMMVQFMDDHVVMKSQFGLQ